MDDDGLLLLFVMVMCGKVVGVVFVVVIVVMGVNGMEVCVEGFGLVSSGVLYNSKRGVELENLLKFDEKVWNCKVSVLM